jgi:hypothetical protein
VICSGRYEGGTSRPSPGAIKASAFEFEDTNEGILFGLFVKMKMFDVSQIVLFTAFEEKGWKFHGFVSILKNFG